jgi:hypothetical protein
MSEKVTITKLDQTYGIPLKNVILPVKQITPPIGAKRNKTMKTFPKSILKLKGVTDPTRSPPLKKSSTRRTIRLLTDIGAKRHRKMVRKTIRRMSDEKVRQTIKRAGLLMSDKSPMSLLRETLEGGMISGIISF